MIAHLLKSDASEGFNQINDFLNGSSIKYALIVNPNIYVSCIKQFWSSVDVKKVNDVMRLQALVDKKKVVITKATLRDALRLDDAEGIECLPNEEIFTELARMGYEKPSTKLTFYKAFFSSQWKFLIHTILQCMSAKRTNEFSSYMASTVICPSTGDLSSHTTKYSSPALTQKVVANMRRVGKGFSRVETPLFEGMIVEEPVGEGADEVHDEGVHVVGIAAEVQITPSQSPQAQQQSPQHQPQPLHDVGISMDLLQNLMDTRTTFTRRVEHLEQDKVAQALEITKLKQRVKKLERKNKAFKLKRLKKVGSSQRIETSDDTVMDDISKQERMIADIDADVDVILEDAKEGDVEKSADVDKKPVELQEVVEVVTTTKLITEVVTAISATITAAAPQLITAAALTLTTAPSAARRRNGVVIRDPKETATPSIIVHTKAKSKDNGKGILVEEPKPLKKQAQIKQDEAYARELEAELNKNIDWDEQKTKEQMDEEDSRALKRLSESQEYKAAKKKKLDEEVEELKRHLQIVPNDEDDVYTEATPLARKVPIVDYEIYNENNKPYYKIKRADGSHQLYLSFLSMLRNFDREDLEVLWQLVKERFASTKPKNFSDDFLLTTLGAMFEKPDIQAQIWKNQRSVHGQAKMLNNVQLEVEEEREVSLELLRQSDMRIWLSWLQTRKLAPPRAGRTNSRVYNHLGQFIGDRNSNFHCLPKTQATFPADVFMEVAEARDSRTRPSVHHTQQEQIQGCYQPQLTPPKMP
nr:hypothetical protein [Tanacetum cinerariifolium]